ncbi:unnamed protein product [Rhodiola kirilowii]
MSFAQIGSISIKHFLTPAERDLVIGWNLQLKYLEDLVLEVVN